MATSGVTDVSDTWWSPTRRASGHRRFATLWTSPRTHQRASHRRPGVVALLEQLDDDPVLLCDCARGAAHHCD